MLLVAAACAPAGAEANPLLSGYGGPGLGDQAIIGATLLNGPGGGGGSGRVSASSSSDSLGAEGANGNALAAGPSRSGPGSPASSRAQGSPQRKTAARRSLDAESTYRALERNANVSSDGALGLSGSEVALIIVALAAMAVIGTLTRWAARTRPAKGHG